MKNCSMYLKLYSKFAALYKDKCVEVDIPSWEQYFLLLAFVISLRSKDAQTTHGCVITDRRNHIIATGYNSFATKSPDDILPNLRDEKYDWMMHSERSALSNLTISPWAIEQGAIAYVTGKPCMDCIQALWSTNVTKVVAAKRTGWKHDVRDSEKFDFFVNSRELEYKEVKPDFKYLDKVLQNNLVSDN